MGNYNFKLEGFRNHWKDEGGYIQWFSCSFETGFENKKLNFVSAHFWFFGIQFFEFSMYRKKD